MTGGVHGSIIKVIIQEPIARKEMLRQMIIHWLVPSLVNKGDIWWQGELSEIRRQEILYQNGYINTGYPLSLLSKGDIVENIVVIDVKGVHKWKNNKQQHDKISKIKRIHYMNQHWCQRNSTMTKEN